MSKFIAFKMINWMYFENQTFRTNGYTALVGVNGSGKSTVIDAMQMLLLGRGAAKFNSNANAEKRTLQSYVRGAIGLEGNEFLRDSDVVTYIAMELEVAKKRHIIGVSVSYSAKSATLTTPIFFSIEDRSITDDLFIENNVPKTYHKFIDDLKRNNIPYKEYTTIYSYQARLRDLFGLRDDKKYFSTLVRAVGLKNVNDCNDFMNKFVLDEDNINLDSIKNNITQIEKLNKEIEIAREKLEALKNILTAAENLESGKYHSQLISCQINEGKILIEENYLDSLKKQNLEYDKERLELLAKNLEISKTLEALRDSKYDLEKSLNELSPDLASKKQELERKRTEYDEVAMNLRTLNTMLEAHYNDFTSLLKLDNSHKGFVDYIREGEYSTNGLRSSFIQFKNSIRDLKSAHDQELLKINFEMQNIKNKHDEISSKLRELENNKPVYDRDLIEFKKYLKLGLKDKFNEDVEVGFLSEYLDINNDEWRNAIEGYLNHQRLYIVVEPKYYNDALALYDKKKDFYKTNIIDSTKLISFDIKEGTLSEFIESNNVVALNYARYILNNVYYCDNVRELNKYKTSITRDCMRYHNYSVGRLDPKWYRTQYIGAKSLINNIRNLKAIENELAIRGNEIKQNYYGEKKILDLLKALQDLTDKLFENQNYFNSIDDEASLFKRIGDLEKDIAYFESNPTYIQTQLQIQEVMDKMVRFGEEKKTIADSINELSLNIKTNEVEYGNHSTILEMVLSERESFDEKILEVTQLELKDIRVNQAYIREKSTALRTQDSANSRIESNLEYAMKDANAKYLFTYEPKYENINKYKQEHQKIDRNMFDYSKQLLDFQEKSRKLFFNTFLNHLYSNVNKAQTEINNLNHSLTNFGFGDIRYEIKYSVTKDKDLEAIYNFAKKYNDEDLEVGAIYLPNFNNDKEKIERLVTDYIFSDNQLKRDMIVDYRKYMDFDILIHTPKGTKSFKKVNRVQSGGEVQVPFYILSAVAFQQTLDSRNKDAFCIMLFDEAFDKMDAQRIDEMLKFYRDKLKVQPVIAMPGKLGAIYNNVDTLLTVVREGNIAEIRDFSHEI